MGFPSLPRLLPGFLQFLVEFLDRQVELVDLPDLARQFRFETIDASRQVLDLLWRCATVAEATRLCTRSSSTSIIS